MAAACRWPFARWWLAWWPLFWPVAGRWPWGAPVARIGLCARRPPGRWCSPRPRSGLALRRSPLGRWRWCAPWPVAAPVPVSWCFPLPPVPLACRPRRQPPLASAALAPGRGRPPRSPRAWACRSWFSLAGFRRCRPGARGGPPLLLGRGRAGFCWVSRAPLFAAGLGGLFCKKSLKNSRHLIYQLVEYICSQALFSMVRGFCGGLKTGKNRNPPIYRLDGSSKPEPTVFFMA